jgi:hypothetical protein
MQSGWNGKPLCAFDRRASASSPIAAARASSKLGDTKFIESSGDFPKARHNFPIPLRTAMVR